VIEPAQEFRLIGRSTPGRGVVEITSTFVPGITGVSAVPESWPAAEDHEQKAKNSKRKLRFNRNCRFGIAGEYAIVGKNSP
jgi:hypothetical protein